MRAARVRAAFVEGVEHVGCGQVAPDAPHPPADAGREGGQGPLDAAADRLVAVVDVVRARGDDDGRVVLLDDGGQLGGDAVRGEVEVGVEVERERRVEEDRDEPGPPRRPPRPRPGGAGAAPRSRGWRSR